MLRFVISNHTPSSGDNGIISKSLNFLRCAIDHVMESCFTVVRFYECASETLQSSGSCPGQLIIRVMCVCEIFRDNMLYGN